MKWEKKTLGEVITLKRGYDLPSQLRKTGTVPIISSSGITDFHSEFAKTGEGVVTGRYGTLGKIFYVNGDYWPLNTTLYVQDFKSNYPRFIYYFLQTLGIEKFNGASAVPGLDRNVLHKVEISFISDIPTQRKIASILSAYDDLIENNLKRIKLLEEKAFLRYKNLQVELKNSPKVSLYDFADIQMGFAFKAEAFNDKGEGNPIIRIRDIPNQITKSYTTQEVEPTYFVEKGDLLIGMDGEFHMNEWLGQRGYLVQRVCRLRAKNSLFQSYLWQSLKEPIHYYETTISGATVAHLGKKHLEEILIPIPSRTMNTMMEELNVMRLLKINLADQNAKLREARDILLPRLMSGEKEV
jgi:type I restriction enzyme, S subunit